eukprot:TRINITY_DN1188_c0_g2_i2.p2 TRINITY_DN1188_c0_g2~~TRINITY_DN1188_c0_g2_i2.p2  ORF type:complete len:128 (+),score=19.11 TRINITY_DN1188_c0_g2_i2:91-474(+)
MLYAAPGTAGAKIAYKAQYDIPLAVDHFRYFAGCLRSQEGGISEIDENTMAYHIHEPLGVVGQIIPWNFPILMAAWKLAPAIGAGNCVVLKPAESTPISKRKKQQKRNRQNILQKESRKKRNKGKDT